MVKTKNSVENPDSQIMDTIPLEQDLQELFQQSYNYDQRTYTSGEKPKNKLGVAVERFEDDLENAGDREEFRKEQIADLRAYNELSKMDISDMSWEQAHRWSELQSQYPNLNIKKEQEDDDMEEDYSHMEDDSIAGSSTNQLHKKVLQSIEDLQDLAAEKLNIDISEHIQFLKTQLKTLINKMKSMDSEDVGRDIEKCLKKYDSKKPVKPHKTNILKKSCLGPVCSLEIVDGLPDINAKPGSTLKIFKGGRWSIS